MGIGGFERGVGNGCLEEEVRFLGGGGLCLGLSGKMMLLMGWDG